jgi:hypothetical protein
MIRRCFSPFATPFSLTPLIFHFLLRHYAAISPLSLSPPLFIFR